MLFWFIKKRCCNSPILIATLKEMELMWGGEEKVSFKRRSSELPQQKGPGEKQVFALLKTWPRSWEQQQSTPIVEPPLLAAAKSKRTQNSPIAAGITFEQKREND